MNSAAELRRFNDSASFEKAKAKVIEALENDPLGLSISQLMTVCRLGIKTVKEALSSIEVCEEQGVYFLKNKPPKIEPTHEQAPVEKVKKEVPMQKPTERRTGLKSDLLTLLQNNKDGLTKTLILELLDITEKQLAKSLWDLNRTHEILRTGDHFNANFQLAEFAENKDVQPVAPAVTSEAEKVEKQEDDEVPMSAVDKARLRIKTIVTTKCELDLCKGEVNELLTKLFGLGQVEWRYADGEMVGVRISNVVVE